MFNRKKKEEKKDDKKEEKKDDKKIDEKRDSKDSKQRTESNLTLRKVKSSDKVDKEELSRTPKKSSSAPDLAKLEALSVDEPFSFSRLINNPLYSDVTFTVGQPPQKVAGHACVIEIRCPSLLKNSKKKKNAHEVDVEHSISFHTFLELLSYLYTGKFDFSKSKEHDVILLLSASSKYEGLERLEYLCSKHLTQEMNTKNMHKLLKATDELQLKYKEDVLHFAVKNYQDFLAEKTANKDLGIGLFQDVVTLYQEFQTGSLKPLPVPVEPKDTFVEDFKALYDSVKLSDISFKLAEANAMGISGSQLRGHKAIVVGRAPGLASVVNQQPTEVSKGLYAVVVKGISPEAFESVLRWVYYNERNIPTSVACELISYCQQHQLTPLQHACVQSMKKGIQVDTVLPILDVSYMKEMPPWFEEQMAEIRPQCIKFAAEHIKDIDFEKIRTKKMSDNIAPEILTFLQHPK